MSSNFARDGRREGGLSAVTVSTVTSSSSGGSASATSCAALPKERKNMSSTGSALSDVFDGGSQLKIYRLNQLDYFTCEKINSFCRHVSESSSTSSSPEFNRKEYSKFELNVRLYSGLYKCSVNQTVKLF